MRADEGVAIARRRLKVARKLADVMQKDVAVRLGVTPHQYRHAEDTGNTTDAHDLRQRAMKMLAGMMRLRAAQQNIQHTRNRLLVKGVHEELDGAALRQARCFTGMTLREAERALVISVYTLSRWERNAHTPTLCFGRRQMRALIEVLGAGNDAAIRLIDGGRA